MPRNRRPPLMWVAFVITALLGAACGDDATAADGSGSSDGPLVVATTTMLGDVARNVVGEDGTVEVLLPTGVDPHDYQASAQQAAMLLEADLVVANGLNLEEGLLDLLDSAVADGGNVIEIAPQLDPIPFSTESDEGGPSLDPHVWLDPLRMADAARLLAAELTRVDDSGPWTANADRYAGELTDADGEIQRLLAAVPEARRVLVTNHDSLGYFADRYAFTIVGTVIPGGSTLANPSSSALAELVADVQRTGVPAIFAETTEPTALVDAVAAESGQDVAVVELFTGSLGEADSGADTLIGMLLTNTMRIADALS